MQSFLSTLLRDARYGLRALRGSPVFTFFALMSLGLGIGANTTVFTIINTLILHPIPAREPGQLAVFYDTGVRGSKQAGSRLPISYLNFEQYASTQRPFHAVAAFSPPQVLTLQTAGGPQRMFGEFATAQFFDTLGLDPALGRFFRTEEASQPGSAPVGVLSFNAWQSRFGGSPSALGQHLELNSVDVTVIGVAPPGFLGVSAVFGPDVWLPASMCERILPAAFRGALSDRTKGMFHGIGRLAPGIRLAQAQAQLETVSAALAHDFPNANEGRTISVRPVSDELYGGIGGEGGVVFGSAVLFAIVMLVLGIACSNVANLLLARASSRRHEVAVRLAIGAPRGRLISQLLTESVLLSVLSFGVGIGVGEAGCRLLWSFIPPEVKQNLVTPHLDGEVLVFALLLSLVTAFVFGLAPALRASKTDVIDVLKEDSRSAGRTKRTIRLANALLTAQVAFSLVCLITAALFIRGIQRAYSITPGFDTAHLALFMMNPEEAGYDQAQLRTYYDTVRDRVLTLPGVASVSWASALPFWNGASHSLTIEGEEQRRKSDQISVVEMSIDKEYFPTLGIRLLEGRAPDERDQESTLPVAVINDTLAREHWPHSDAIGDRIQLAGETGWRRIIGVAQTVNYTSLGEAPQPCVYIPARQGTAGGMALYVRSHGNPSTLLAAVPEVIHNIDPNTRITDSRTGSKLIEQVLFGPRIGVTLLSVFGLLALALAGVGLYGIMAGSVAQRRREISVRMALGASPQAVRALIVAGGMRLVLYGIAVGVAVCLLLGRALSRMLFGIDSADPVSFLAATLVLTCAALLACYFPARSATRVDPMVALRSV